jgi:hypothetical protein
MNGRCAILKSYNTFPNQFSIYCEEVLPYITSIYWTIWGWSRTQLTISHVCYVTITGCRNSIFKFWDGPQRQNFHTKFGKERSFASEIRSDGHTHRMRTVTSQRQGSWLTSSLETCYSFQIPGSIYVIGCKTLSFIAHFAASCVAPVLNITCVLGKSRTKQLGHSVVRYAEQYTIWIITNMQNLSITNANIEISFHCPEYYVVLKLFSVSQKTVANSVWHRRQLPI